MSTKVYFINSPDAQYSDHEFAWFQSLILNQGIVGDPDTGAMGFEVTENGTPDMSVLVSPGKVLVEVTIDARTFKVIAESDAEEQIIISANSSGANRVDAIIARVDVDIEVNETKNNVVTIEVVTGSGTSPLTDGAIDTAVGNDGWYRLANITVPNSTSNIEDGDITSTRSKVEFNNGLSISPLLPTGIVSPYAGSSAPTGWLICSGDEVSRATYSDLFAIIGTTYGSGDGSTTFNLPDLRSSFAIGAGEKIKTFNFATTDVNVSTDVITVPDNRDMITGAKFVLTTSGVVPTLADSTVRAFSIDASGIFTGAILSNVVGNGQKIYINSESSTNLSAGAEYYVINYSAGVSFQVSTTKGGGAVATGNAGSGTAHTKGLTPGSTYYTIKLTDTTIKLASTLANALAGTAISLATQGTGTHTFTKTLQDRVLGESGGEEDHALTIEELPAHVHPPLAGSAFLMDSITSGSGLYSSSSNDAGASTTGSAGGNEEHNNVPPYVTVNYIIKT